MFWSLWAGSMEILQQLIAYCSVNLIRIRFKGSVSTTVLQELNRSKYQLQVVLDRPRTFHKTISNFLDITPSIFHRLL